MSLGMMIWWVAMWLAFYLILRWLVRDVLRAVEQQEKRGSKDLVRLHLQALRIVSLHMLRRTKPLGLR